MSTNHKFRMIGGRYVCQAEDCDYDTLNRWAAEAHFVENTDEEVDTDVLDAPEEILS